jgi:hypothetical protein
MILRTVALALTLLGDFGQVGGDAAGLGVLRGRRSIPPARYAPQAQATLPVLDFPEPGLDDTTAYQGYQTRFYRDSKQNTVQIYLEPRGGRVVLLWADAANESVGFTVRDSAGRPAQLHWGAEAAQVTDSGRTRTLEYQLTTQASQVELGWFLLGSMRVERDFQYARRHLKPFTARPFQVAEESLLVAAVGRLPVQERRHHLALLNAGVIEELRSRLHPTLTVTQRDTTWVARVERPSLDGRNRLVLELSADARETSVHGTNRTLSIRPRSSTAVRLTVRVTTDAPALTPLTRQQIFNPRFLDFLAGARAAHDSVLRPAGPDSRGHDSAAVRRYRWLEREVRAVELLCTEEKLMAGLPNFATYFGRDMMMTALMMRPIWNASMAEHVIASVLRKLGPAGDVSHEEALGGQAIRENAVVYDSLLTEHFRAQRGNQQRRADAILSRATQVLRNLQATRENYHMVDDEFQLPVLASRYLTDSAVPAERKRAFLLDTSNAQDSRLSLMLRELVLVATKTGPYVQQPRATNLVSFPKRDATHWRSASWRDSDAGYAGGRFAMDINVIWAPTALESMAAILRTLPALGLTPQALHSLAPEIAATPLAHYLRDSSALHRAIETWKGARRHFVVTLGPTEVQKRIGAKLAWLPAPERHYWRKVLAEHREMRDSLTFLALALDENGHPIPIVNTDPATGLFLTARTKAEEVLEEVEPFGRPYPVGLFVEALGPLAANDAYAPRPVWDRFRADLYHGPRVVWGREVNLLFLALANQITAAFDGQGRIKDPALVPYIRIVDETLRRTLAAVSASGLQHNELWSYEIKAGRLLPTRYGTSSDVQLWNTTDLAVQFLLSGLPMMSP